MKPKDYIQLLVSELKRLKKIISYEPTAQIEYEATKLFYRSLHNLFNKR